MGRPKKFNRELVLRKTLPVFWQHGYARTTMPDLEKATGVNKSGLYSEFENKEALFLACIAYYFETCREKVILAAHPQGWANIRRLFEQVPNCDPGQNGSFSVNLLRELPDLPPEAEPMIRNGRDEVCQAIKANIWAVEPGLDAEMIAEQLSVFFSGLCIEANLDADADQTQRKVDAFLAMLARSGPRLGL